jgi:hypothetical protein
MAGTPEVFVSDFILGSDTMSIKLLDIKKNKIRTAIEHTSIKIDSKKSKYFFILIFTNLIIIY